MATVNINNFALFVYDASDFSKPPEILPPLPSELRGENFVPTHWSPDGKKLVGGSAPVTWVYSFDTKEYRLVNRGGAGPGQRLLFSRQGRIFVGDWLGGNAREVLAVPGETLLSPRLSSDGWLYFLTGSATGDIWVVRFGDENANTADEKRRTADGRDR